MHAKTLLLALFAAATVSAAAIDIRQNNNQDQNNKNNNQNQNQNQNNQNNQNQNEDQNQAQNNNQGNAADAAAGAAAVGANAAADFGTCTPTMDFVFGRNGRAADEGTFLPTDPAVAEGQSEALNPNIITNRICDQLTNVCGANDAAKQLCADAQATVQGLGTKDQTTADAFNSALGF